jgi:hypothetical protein
MAIKSPVIPLVIKSGTPGILGTKLRETVPDPSLLLIFIPIILFLGFVIIGGN